MLTEKALRNFSALLASEATTAAWWVMVDKLKLMEHISDSDLMKALKKKVAAWAKSEV